MIESFVSTLHSPCLVCCSIRLYFYCDHTSVVVCNKLDFRNPALFSTFKRIFSKVLTIQITCFPSRFPSPSDTLLKTSHSLFWIPWTRWPQQQTTLEFLFFMSSFSSKSRISSERIQRERTWPTQFIQVLFTQAWFGCAVHVEFAKRLCYGPRLESPCVETASSPNSKLKFIELSRVPRCSNAENVWLWLPPEGKTRPC